MFRSERQSARIGRRAGRAPGHQRPSRGLFGIVAAAVGAALVLTGVAFAAGAGRTLGSANNATLGKTIVVDSHGRTVYALSGETVHHLLCKNKACFAFWPPVTVRSRTVKLKAASGVQGHLALLRRSDGKLQVTLRGLPLYRFAHDRSKGQASGEGIESFGGTWHTVPASASQGMTPGSTPSPSSSSSTSSSSQSTSMSTSTGSTSNHASSSSSSTTSTTVTTSSMSSSTSSCTPYCY